MGYVIAVAAFVVLLAGAFALGRRTGDGRWGFLAALLPLGLLGWSGYAAATEPECYEVCASTFLFAGAVISVLPALILAGAVMLGASSARGDAPSRRSSGPAAT